MRRRVTVRPKALDDMEEIYFYGLAHFGLQVAKIICAACIRLSITLATTNSAKTSMQSAPAYGYCPSPTT